MSGHLCPILIIFFFLLSGHKNPLSLKNYDPTPPVTTSAAVAFALQNRHFPNKRKSEEIDQTDASTSAGPSSKRRALSSIENILDIGDGIEFLIQQQTVEDQMFDETNAEDQNVEKQKAWEQNTEEQKVKPRKTNKPQLIKKSKNFQIQTPRIITPVPLAVGNQQVQIIAPSPMPIQPQIEFVDEQGAQGVENTAPIPASSVKQDEKLNFEDRQITNYAGMQILKMEIVEIYFLNENKIFFR